MKDYYNNRQAQEMSGQIEKDLHEVAGLMCVPSSDIEDGYYEWVGTDKEWKKYEELLAEEEAVF